jgi:hypothetical protein
LLASSSGPSKKEAEQNAAREALLALTAKEQVCDPKTEQADKESSQN